MRTRGRPNRRPSAWRAKRARAHRTRMERCARQRPRAARRRRERTNSPWWVKHPLEFFALEREVPEEYGGFVRRRVGRALVYSGVVDAGDAGLRRVTFAFAGPPSRRDPVVFSDGPRSRRHRYRWSRPTSLCMWYPTDPDRLRWTLREGLVGLIDRTRSFLIAETWYRVYGRWPREEVHRELRPRDSEHGRPTRTRRDARSASRRRCWCGKGRYVECHGAGAPADELSSLMLRE